MFTDDYAGCYMYSEWIIGKIKLVRRELWKKYEWFWILSVVN